MLARILGRIPVRPALIACLALSVVACGEDERAPRAPSTTTTPTNAADPHATPSGPHLDGVISDLSSRRVVLHVLPERREKPEVAFAIPAAVRERIDIEHLRGDASAGVPTRIYYRRDGRRLVMTAYAHPPR